MEIISKKSTSYLANAQLKPESKKDASFYYIKGISSYNSGNHEEAEKFFCKAIEVENNNSIAYFNRGTFYLNEKKFKFAIEDFHKALILRPKFSEALYNLACANAHILSFREAIQNLKKAIRLEKRLSKRALSDPDFLNISKMKEFQEITYI